MSLSLSAQASPQAALGGLQPSGPPQQPLAASMDEETRLTPEPPLPGVSYRGRTGRRRRSEPPSPFVGRAPHKAETFDVTPEPLRPPAVVAVAASTLKSPKMDLPGVSCRPHRRCRSARNPSTGVSCRSHRMPSTARIPPPPVGVGGWSVGVGWATGPQGHRGSGGALQRPKIVESSSWGFVPQSQWAPPPTT